MDLGEGESRRPRERIVKATTTRLNKPHPNPPPQPGTEAPEKLIETSTREKAMPQNLSSYSQNPLNGLLGSTRR